MTTDSKNVPPAGKGGKERTFKFPSAFTVLFAVTVGVWLLAFVVPTGAYKISEKTAPTTVSTPDCPSATG